MRRTTPALLVASFLTLQLFVGAAGIAGNEKTGYLAAVDRIEEDFAVLVLEDGHSFTLPAYVIGLEAEEGDVLQIHAISDGTAANASKEASYVTIGELVDVSR